MAWVYKAKKVGIEGFERVLAIKRILPHLSSDEEFIDMFVAEAKLAARLTHKNIVQIYDFVKSGEDYLILMEYVPGKDLRTILRRCHAKNINIPPSLALYIGKEVASALSSAHTQRDHTGKSLNIIHRDISPQNILVSYGGEVKVVDFGIAKAETHAKTSTGVLKGKISYMSPEQAWGKPIDLRSDIFSLGLVLYEMFTGDKLFKGDTELNTLERVREAAVQPLPSAVNGAISPAIEAKVLKALSRDPASRYQSAAEMELDLGRALSEIPHPDPSIHLREFMHELFQAEVAEEDLTDEDDRRSVYVADLKQAAPQAKSEVSRQPARTEDSPDPEPPPAAPPQQKSNTFTIAILAGIVVLLGIAGYFAYNAMFHRAQPAVASKEALPGQAATLPTGGSGPAEPVKAVPEPSKSPDQVAKASTGVTPVPAQPPKPSAAPPAPPPKPVEAPRPPVPAPPPKQIETVKGALAVTAKPWATVHVDGKDYGKTPQTIKDLELGTYTVRLENPDFTAWETKVNISKKGTVKISHSFGGFGKLVMNSKPWANVFLNGVHKGQTPLTLDKVPSGEHQVKFVRDGYAETVRTVTIKPSGQTTLSIPLERKDN